MPLRCLVISYYFPPTGGGGVQRITKLIKYLSKNNWEFTVLTSNANSLSNIPYDESFLEEIPERTEIIRLLNPVNKKQKLISREKTKPIKSNYFTRWISSFIFIPDIYKKWSNLAEEEVYSLTKKRNFDLIFVTSPPYSLACLASRLTENIKIPVVLDMRDPWITNPYKIFPSRIHFKREKKLEKQMVTKIKFGISATKSLIDHYLYSGYITSSSNWLCISNGFDEEDFAIHPQMLKKDVFNIAFSGTFYSHINNPKFLFKAISKLPIEKRRKILFHHIGNSNINLEKLASKYNISGNVKEWGYKEHLECLSLLAGMDSLCFILDSSNRNAKNTIGGKVYEYLRLRKPILALVPENGEAAHLIKNTSSGIVVDPHDEKTLIETLKRWISNKPIITSLKPIEEYERSFLAQKYLHFFQKILSETNSQNM